MGQSPPKGLRQANQDYLIAYNPDGTLAFPATPIATIQGIDWRTIRVGSWAYTFQKTSFLTPTPLWKGQIQGYTDVTGSPASNLRLGSDRAEAVRRYLSQQGVALNRMATISYGQDNPVAPNKTRAGRAQNRRVVVVVLE